MSFLKDFFDKNNLEYFENFDVSNISSIKLGMVAKWVVFPKSNKELILILKYFHSKKIYYKVFGNLSNVLVVDNLSYPIVITNKIQDEILLIDNMVTVSAGVHLSNFFNFLKKNQLSGFEGLSGIPATVGGAIMGNAGAFGYSISDCLKKITVYFDGKVFDVNKNEIHFAYHYSNLSRFVILSATFLFDKKNEYDIIKLCNEFNYKRNISQPNGLSLGSVFKRVSGKSAGFYINRSGLKNFRVGGVIVSSKHANFFVNDKNGSVCDFLRLLVKVQTQVEKQFGISLIPEFEKVGDKNETFSRFTYSFK